MLSIDAAGMDFRILNQLIRDSQDDCELLHCCGQRFLAAGLDGHSLQIHGVPGNALGAYLDGAEITVFGNAQDAVGDTMNRGRITIHGNIGDAAGYAMRGGEIFIRDDAGYRAGIHMKAYGDKCPVMIIGGRAGSFLGEYQAGGIIIVLGLGQSKRPIVGNFPCTGMHGGMLLLRSDCRDLTFPDQVTAAPASAQELQIAAQHIRPFCERFGLELDAILDAPFTVVRPNSSNPYKQLYAAN